MSERTTPLESAPVAPPTAAELSTERAGESASAASPTEQLLARAAMLAAEGRWAEALALYEQAGAAGGDDVRALLGQGVALRGLLRYDASETVLRRAIRLAPELAEAHHQLGTTLFRRGNHVAAAPELRRATELDPECGPAFHLLGEALSQTGDAAAAVAVLERAVELQPANGKAYYALGIALDRMGQPDRAAEMYRRSREVGR